MSESVMIFAGQPDAAIKYSTAIGISTDASTMNGRLVA